MTSTAPEDEKSPLRPGVGLAVERGGAVAGELGGECAGVFGGGCWGGG